MKTNLKTQNVNLPNGTLKTKHVASHFGIKPVQLRRVLRSMPRYADGVHTNYRWAMPADKSLIAEIGKAITARAAAAENAKTEAQAKLAPTPKPAAKSKSKSGNRKSKIAADPIAERQQAAAEKFDAQTPNPETEQQISA